MLYVTYALSALIMLAAGFVYGVVFTRRWKLQWRLFWIGATTFVFSQVGHIPFNALVTLLFERGILPQPPQAWRMTFNIIFLGLSAGIFEESARYLALRYWAKEARDWRNGLLFAAGHGGIEATIVGALFTLTFVQVAALRNADLTTIVPADQLALAQQQINAFWSASWIDSLLPAWERLWTIPCHLAMTLMVLQMFRRGKKRWYFAAIGWHTLLNASVLYTLQIWGAYVAEGLVMGFGLLSIGWIFVLKDAALPMGSAPPTGAASPANPAPTFVEGAATPEPPPTPEALNSSRFSP